MDRLEKYCFDQKTQETMERLTVPFAVYQFLDKRVVTLTLSDGFCRLFGYEDRALAYYDMDHDMYKDTHPDDVARIANAAYEFATQGGRYEVIYRTRVKESDAYRIIHAYGEHVYTDEGIRLAHVWYSDEGIYESESGKSGFALNSSLSNALHENSIVKASQYDYLTGLPSMSYFFELAESGKSKAQERGERPVLMYMDFVGMKFYNTKHGFAEGDKLLRSFAKILSGLFGNEHSCRIGADHFAVQCEETGLDEKLQQMFRECEKINDGKTLLIHVGVYVGQNEEVHVSVACDRAKMACTALRGRYESAVNYFSQALSDVAVNRQYVIENIDKAIEEKWIQVYLQPIVRSVNEQVCDVEALARWIDPVRGFLSPADFIPALEEAGLIYKLDLYIVDQVLETIKKQEKEGFLIIPHSINLSRSDFDVCDIVEEIKRRVDESGVSRDRITIEITESIIGGDFEFMKEQIQRFRELGFSVWMDDFGSGYSSLDVLQSIRFDLIKFDMSFLRKLDEGEKSKIVLTELMRMATSLDVDTVCEGVETKEQVRFLQEIGCSKLQGYYYCKPIPFEKIREMRNNKTLIANENPKESGYYESIGRISMYDLGAVTNEEENDLHNVFSTLPIAILEVTGDKARYVRGNRSYRMFAKRYFGEEILNGGGGFDTEKGGFEKKFIKELMQCSENGNRAFFDKKMPDGATARLFLRRVSNNPVTGSVAVAVAVLSVMEPDESTTYADIASSLAADYYNIYLIDLDTNDYIEYSSKVGGEEVSLERHGGDFFESARRDTMTRIYEEDREPFLALFTKERVLEDIETQGVFTTTYRLIDTGTPVYVNMKITRMKGGNRLILGVSIVDAHMKELEEARNLRLEKTALGRVAALSPNYFVLYTVDPVTGSYTQYNASDAYEKIGLAAQGEDFFGDARKNSHGVIAPEDLEEQLRILTKETMLDTIRKDGFFIRHFRMVLDNRIVPVSMRATLVKESDGEKLILGLANDEKEYKRQLEEAYKKASDTAVIYTHLAHALARGYTDLYYVNIDTDALIEFHTDDEHGVLNEVRRGTDFFEGCRRDVKLFVHPEDEAAFVEAMDRDFLEKALEENRVFELIYRRIKGDRTFYVQMKVSRMEDDPNIIVLAVSDIDELMRKRREEERIREERIIYARLHAITGNFVCVYVVNPETNHYREFSATDAYEQNCAQKKEGTDFFETVRKAACEFNHPKDLDFFLANFTKENVLKEIKRCGIFNLGYRLMMEGKPLHVQMKAAIVEEKEGPRLIVGLNNIDAQVRQEEEFGRRLQLAQNQVNVDTLTGVKNRHAFLEVETQIDIRVRDHRQLPFAIVMLDVNDLKKVNDTAGHQAGDQYLRDACKIVCDIFKHSPVFRVGGDEFAVLLQGEDYADREALYTRMKDHNVEALQSGGIVIACGMAEYENDECSAVVFERADHRMYENKSALKAGLIK